MRKAGHRKSKSKVYSKNLLIVFAMLVVLPTSFFIANNVVGYAAHQDNSDSMQTTPIAKASPLFDVKVTVLPEYKSAVAGSKVLATVSMKNLGSPGNPIDVELAISVADASGAVVYSYSKDTLAVATQLVVVREVLVPTDVKSGTYLFFVSVKYDSQIAESFDSFIVTEPRIAIMAGKAALYALLMILIAVVAILAIILLRHYSSSNH